MSGRVTRWMGGALAAIVVVSFTVAFAVGLASPPRDEPPRTTVMRVPAGGPPSRLVADRGELRPVAALPALRVPAATAEPATPTPTPTPTVVAAAPAPPAPSPADPSPAAPAPAPVAPVQAPPAPQPPAEAPERGPVFDSEG